MTGREVMNFGRYHQTNIDLDIHSLPQGAYLLNVQTPHENLKQKFVVQ